MARKVKYDFDPLKGVRRKLSKEKQEEVMDDVANFVKEEVLLHVGSGKSPVSKGGSFKALSKEYKKVKRKAGAGSSPNLELTGDMLDSLVVTNKDKFLRLEHSDSDESKKADNHNKFTSKSKRTGVPRRPYIPRDFEGESLNKKIKSGIKKIVDAAVDPDGDN